MDQQTMMGDKAIGLLRRIHERGGLNDSLSRELAELLGLPGDPEVKRITDTTRRWSENGAGYEVLRDAVRSEASRLRDIANAIGAGTSAQVALSKLKSLAETVEGL
jgi:hypothetical protein